MFIVGSYTLAVIFCFITMLCWGSWGNTQKLAAKSWRYELFYWDYVIGMVLFSLLLAFTAGSIGSEGRPFLQDLAQASWASIGWVLLGAVVFNVSNILLSASVSIAFCNKTESPLSISKSSESTNNTYSPLAISIPVFRHTDGPTWAVSPPELRGVGVV